jgi:DNA-directed RNA polymerase subunit H (RpoH/RPB5)
MEQIVQNFLHARHMHTLQPNPDSVPSSVPLEAFTVHVEEQLHLMYVASDSSVSLGKSHIRKIVQSVDPQESPYKNTYKRTYERTYILSNMSSHAALLAEQSGLEPVDLQLFRFRRTLSRLVPNYTLVQDEEALLRSLKIEKIHLPRVHVTDPIIRYHGWKVGRIVYVPEDDRYRAIV